MRGAEGRTVVPDADHVQRIFNIYHPYDPVAYRLEPLVHEIYQHLRPLKVLNFANSKRNYDTMRYECRRWLQNYVNEQQKDGLEKRKKVII